jgi:hypothetical protein
LVHECGRDADAPADASLASLASVALVDHSPVCACRRLARFWVAATMPVMARSVRAVKTQGIGLATQLRDYRIADGALNEFVNEWRTHLVPIGHGLGFTIDGAWVVEVESRFLWLLSHPGEWDAFEEADQGYYASPQRAALDSDPARLIEEQRNVRLTEVDRA